MRRRREVDLRLATSNTVSALRLMAEPARGAVASPTRQPQPEESSVGCPCKVGPPGGSSVPESAEDGGETVGALLLVGIGALCPAEPSRAPALLSSFGTVETGVASGAAASRGASGSAASSAGGPVSLGDEPPASAGIASLVMPLSGAGVQGPQVPPQSTVISLPFLTPSVQVGGMH